MLDFQIELVLAEILLQRLPVRHFRQVERAEPQRPCTLIPFGRDAGAVAPGICRIIERARVDDRPVEEIAARIMGVAIGVEHVANAELADRQHQPVGAPAPRELVGGGLDRLAVSAQPDRLAEEQALQPDIGRAPADLIGLRAGKARDAQRIGQPEALIDLRVDPRLRPVPRPHTCVERGVERLPHLPGRQAVRPGIGRAEAEHPLRHQRRLRMDRPIRAPRVRRGILCQRRGGEQRAGEQDGVREERTPVGQEDFLRKRNRS